MNEQLIEHLIILVRCMIAALVVTGLVIVPLLLLMAHQMKQLKPLGLFMGYKLYEHRKTGKRYASQVMMPASVQAWVRGWTDKLPEEIVPTEAEMKDIRE